MIRNLTRNCLLATGCNGDVWMCQESIVWQARASTAAERWLSFSATRRRYLHRRRGQTQQAAVYFSRYATHRALMLVQERIALGKHVPLSHRSDRGDHQGAFADDGGRGARRKEHLESITIFQSPRRERETVPRYLAIHFHQLLCWPPDGLRSVVREVHFWLRFSGSRIFRTVNNGHFPKGNLDHSIAVHSGWNQASQESMRRRRRRCVLVDGASPAGVGKRDCGAQFLPVFGIRGEVEGQR